MDWETAGQSLGAAEAIERRARETAERFSSMLLRTAAALEKSAELADDHARRCEQAGRTEDASVERDAALSARAAAKRARSHAVGLLGHTEQ